MDHAKVKVPRSVNKYPTPVNKHDIFYQCYAGGPYLLFGNLIIIDLKKAIFSYIYDKYCSIRMFKITVFKIN